MKILIATIADIEALTNVEIESKLRSFEKNEEVAIDYDTRLYRWNTYFKELSPASAKPERVVYKAVIDDQIIGYIAGHLTGRYDKDAKIQSFYVLRDRQRSGAGTLLLKNLLSWLATHNVQSLCVGIEPDNPFQAFYLKYGGVHLNPHWICWDDIKTLRAKTGQS
ncbi:GNAT family N-acetyltransferase [Mucilaginibacter sp. BJC16-A38]|uniref:GNAT family N-acetyltransferase n=1 Tax=Mucilaginibacter phenanthrenivorans TaxID=1234842 RepID=UPI0021578F9B|nr:GNAT family N-acetyltransferase [Mucilaginibacter phenanthrenivorans]MCR8561260.1 GNAT family N-acetyltransferase [Mucilaginibacter phenanthrenivorans]